MTELKHSGSMEEKPAAGLLFLRRLHHYFRAPHFSFPDYFTLNHIPVPITKAETLAANPPTH